MTPDEINAELSQINSHLPKTYGDLIQQIDRFIFAAQKGFDLCTELFLLRKDVEAAASIAFKRKWALTLIEAEKEGVSATGTRFFAESRCVEEEAKLILAEKDSMAARMRRDQYLERINTYKKLKGDNVNARGNG